MSDVKHLPGKVICQVPYFETLTSGRWNDCKTTFIDLTDIIKTGTVTIPGIDTALLWARSQKINLTPESWKDICNTARFFGCFDERYIAVLGDLVMHEELDAFGVAQWLGETNNGTKPGDLYALLVDAVSQVISNIGVCTDMAKYKTVPTWIIDDIIRRVNVASQETYFWLCEVSRYVETFQSEQSSTEGIRGFIERCWMHHGLATLNSKAAIGYPFTCPLCSEDFVTPRLTVIKRSKIVRSYVRVLKVDLFYGVLEVSEPKVLPDRVRSVDVLFDSAGRQRQIPTSLKVHFTNVTSTFQGILKPGQHTTLKGSTPSAEEDKHIAGLIFSS